MAIRTGTASPTLEHVFWLTPGHPSEPLTWYCGTIPNGLFESRDGGLTWRPVTGFNDAPERSGWGIGPVPGGTITHSVREALGGTGALRPRFRRLQPPARRGRVHRGLGGAVAA